MDVREYNGRIYYFNHTKNSLTQQQLACGSRGRELIRIKDQEENQFILRNIRVDAYIGAICSDNVWYLSDGSLMNYKNFSPESRGFRGCYSTGYAAGISSETGKWFGFPSAGSVCVDYSVSSHDEMRQRYHNLSIEGLKNFNETLEMIEDLKVQFDDRIQVLLQQNLNQSEKIESMGQIINDLMISLNELKSEHDVSTSNFSSIFFAIFLSLLLSGLLFAILFSLNRKYDLISKILQKMIFMRNHSDQKDDMNVNLVV